MQDFRRLEVWEESLHLATQIYELTRAFPAEERFGLTAQLRSAAVSVGSNIAEGAGRGSPAELARFIRISLGSLAELDIQLELAARLGVVEPRSELVDWVRVLPKRLLRFHDRITQTRP